MRKQKQLATPIYGKQSFLDKLISYKKKPGSLIMAILVMLATAFTLFIILYILGYILAKGIPYITPSLFSWEYNSENVSLMPALITTIEMTVLSLVIAVPLGIFTAIYLVEYAKSGNRLVKLIRLTTETLSGIPSIIYGLFGMLFFVTYLKWKYSLLAGGLTLSIMILPLIMRTTEEALLAVPASYREGILRPGGRSAADGVPGRSSQRHSRYPCRRDPGHRPNRRGNSSPDLYCRHSGPGSSDVALLRADAGRPYVSPVQ